MKNKIQKFSKGNFRTGRPEVIFEETNLVLIIGEGEVYRGSFIIKSENEHVIRGLVYPSSFRVKLKDSGFEGNPARVEFTYDGRGLKPGHVEEGKFTVVCTGGEYELSFTAIIEKPYVMTTYGKVQSTDDFRKLAIKDFSEAGRLFRSREFYEIVKYENERTFYLYDNMRKWSLGEQAMEEFLVGIKQKECIFLTLQGEGMLFEDIKEPNKGTITIVKNTWGFMPIHIETEGAFLRVTKPDLTTEDFVGNSYEMEYLVRPEYLHGGRNYGTIRFITPYEALSYEIEVLQNQEYDEEHYVPELLYAQSLKEYIGYMAGRIELDTWVENAIENVAAIRRIKPMSEIYQLLQAHVYIIGKKFEEAKWILENYNYNRFAIGKDPITNCYYLFLTALIRENDSHMERVLDEIGKTYMRHQDSWLLLYMILQIDGRYKNPYKRLEVLEQLGLGYLTLGEETPSLSGGEAQRLKLASEMGKAQSDSLFIFDEPTIGLHPLDVQTLLQVFQTLIENGATVVIIEHDLDVIRNGDYIIDMGPGGGEAGGRVVACGTPEQIKKNKDSITGRFL